MKISVVIPTYNRALLLKRCLLSLCIQQFKKDEYEIIVVADGASPESIPDVLFNSAMPDVHYIFLNAKRGAAAARNAGWHSAKGELIVFTDDDTIPQPEFLRAYWNAYRQSKFECIAFTGKVIVPVADKPTDFEKNTAYLETAEFVTANCACSKSALTITGGFDEHFTMAWREDSDLHFKLIKAGINICKIEKAGVLHPVRTCSYGISLKEQKKCMFNALLYKKHPDLYKQRISSYPVWKYYIIIGCAVTSATLLISGSFALSAAFALTFLFLVLLFALNRLKDTSHTWRHTSEMLVTSACIPFLSVFWTLYGAFKYRIWFL